jgi:hypothetical protein
MGRKVVEGRGRMARRLGSAVRWVRGGERGRDQQVGSIQHASQRTGLLSSPVFLMREGADLGPTLT